MKGSNVTVCLFVVQESYLRNTYYSVPHASLLFQVAFPFRRHSSTMWAPADWTAARRRGVQLGPTGFCSTPLRIGTGGKNNSGSGRRRRTSAGEEGVKVVVKVMERVVGPGEIGATTRWCEGCAFDCRSIIV